MTTVLPFVQRTGRFSPETGLRRDQGLVAVIVIGEGFWRLRDVNLVGFGRDEVFGFFAIRGGLAERRVCFEVGETAGGGVVKEVATEVVGAEAEGRILVDRNRRIGIGFATNRRVARRGAGGVLVQVVRLVGRSLSFALLIVGRRRAAVAKRVVGEVFREARDRLAVLRSAG